MVAVGINAAVIQSTTTMKWISAMLTIIQKQAKMIMQPRCDVEGSHRMVQYIFPSMVVQTRAVPFRIFLLLTDATLRCF